MTWEQTPQGSTDSLSVVVTSVSFDGELKGLVDSFMAARDSRNHELIIILKTGPEVTLGFKNIRVIVCKGRSRCFRKDYGASVARYSLLCFMDSDCRFAEDYFLNLNKIGPLAKVVRGKVNYLHDGSYFGMAQSEYRRLCDECYFRLETFTPNLIVRKDFFQTVGGFDEAHNIDANDDFILSEKVKKVLPDLQKIDDLCVDCIPDDRLARTMRSWFGYGTGYGFRWWKYHGSDRRDVWRFPPLVIPARIFTVFLPVLILQWIVCWSGFVVGLIKYRDVQRHETVTCS
ncbi:hypothetical protein G6K86_30400 [Agrobacterium rhizogenes]|nr:hypothetical protein [Rhizobium rhizogenes]